MHERLLRLHGERVAQASRRRGGLVVEVRSEECLVVLGEHVHEPRPEAGIGVCTRGRDDGARC